MGRYASCKGGAVKNEGIMTLPGDRVDPIDDRCANPRNLFWAFHAPCPSKNAQIEYIYKNITKKYIFQNFTIKYIFQKIKIFISKNLLKKYWLEKFP
jgi:hypothetical protein